MNGGINMDISNIWNYFKMCVIIKKLSNELLIFLLIFFYILSMPMSLGAAITMPLPGRHLSYLIQNCVLKYLWSYFGHFCGQ